MLRSQNCRLETCMLLTSDSIKSDQSGYMVLKKITTDDEITSNELKRLLFFSPCQQKVFLQN